MLADFLLKLVRERPHPLFDLLREIRAQNTDIAMARAGGDQVQEPQRKIYIRKPLSTRKDSEISYVV